MEGGEVEAINGLTFTFDKSTDFYGRVIIYVVEIWGEEE
jgi:hypothetical protein